MTGRGALRVTLATVAVADALTGLNALLVPREFFEHFPLGTGWVAQLPPFNEHLTTDVGGFYLAFGALIGWAACSLERALVLPVVAAWALFCLAHLAFHVTHLAGMSPTAAIVQTAGLVAVLAPAAVALALQRANR